MPRTVLIGLDGATFTVLDPLMADGTMPFLRDLTCRGARGLLLSTPNPLTPPAWTSLMTGRTPGNHGIFDFIRAEERNHEVYFTLYNSRDIQCETIWSVATRHGKRVTLLNFPMTFPPPRVEGHVIPGMISWKHLKRGVHPESLYERLKTLPGLSYKEMAWDFNLEKKIIRGVDAREYEDWVRFHIKRDAHWFEIARHLMQTEPSDLTAIVFDGTDKLQHICWRFLDPACAPAEPSAWESTMIGLCREYFRRLDGYIAGIVELAGPGAQIFLASDHGFAPSTEVFRVNVWLHARGYLTWRDLGESEMEADPSLRRRLDSNFVLLDWENTRAYARTSSSNGIYIRTATAPGQSGVPAREYEAFRRELVEGLYGVVNPDTGERVVERVLTREEAFPGGQMPKAPDLTLVLRDRGFVSIKNISPAVQTRPEVAGTHHPEGIFIASGPHIRRRAVIAPRPIADVAATLLHSLGLEVPEDLEGRVPLEVFDPEWLRTRPVRVGAPTRPAGEIGRPEQPAFSPNEEALVFERLKALGYVE